MAIADKNILITPNRSGILGNQPNVVFTGADSSIGDSAAITVTARPENSGTLSFTGTAGQLFSITNSLEGTIFAVNDVSGIPSLEIDDAGIIKMAEFNGRILLGGATDDSTSLLQLNGHMHLADNGEIRLGNDSDLRIYHTGSVANIINITGDLIIADTNGSVRIQGKYGEQSIVANADSSVDLYHDADRKFYTKSRGATVLGEIRADSANVKRLNLQNANGQAFRIVTNTDGAMDFCADGDTSKVVLTLDDEDGQPIFTFKEEGGTSIFDGGDTDVTTHKDFLFDSANAIMFDKSDQSLKFGDNYYAKFGASSDLQIYHNGLHSYVRDQGTGHLYITTNGDFIHLGNGGALQSGKFSPSGAAELFYNGTERFETTDSGVNVTGSLRVNNAELSTGASAGFAIAMAIAL
tara:strand:+ start:604 stop:1830 length:1227 start_codon:yes stop_codon:yes gene_type:complete